MNKKNKQIEKQKNNTYSKQVEQQQYPYLKLFMDKIKPIQKQFEAGNQIYINTEDKQLIQEAYYEIGGNRINLTCSTCVHDAITRLIYFYENKK